jgi:predicted RNA methylase
MPIVVIRQVLTSRPPAGLIITRQTRANGMDMTKKKKEEYKLPEKIYWHIYSLQSLNAEKFVRVVDKILRKEYILIK